MSVEMESVRHRDEWLHEGMKRDWPDFDDWLARVKAEAAAEAEATTQKIARDHNSLIREMGRVRNENRQLRDQVSVLTEARDLWREDALAADQRKQGE